ncbi:WD repeat-containing protein 37-like [Paramacrobiotus metropolitanus]|uniref:WD repeat-containing protein 37-like n=1 Tax=Paramacrobiotus metropolitanus TaxID=2943436 RepID=UPI00244619D4|nr:WD repeat-containing protein 37-like [Paramacrobiotus metropolitanus]
MDPVPVRRRSQGISGKPPVQSVPLQSGSGMKNSISRPDSFLPNNGVSINNQAPEPSLAGPFNSHAASSGSEICRDRLIHLLGSVAEEYDKVVKENARLRLQIAQLTQQAGICNEGSSSVLSGSYQTQQQQQPQPSRLMTTGLTPSSKFVHSHMVSNDDTHSPPQTSSVDNSFHKLKILKEEQLQKFKTTSRRKIASATSRLRNVPTTEAQIVRSYARHNDGVWDIAAPKFSTCPYTVFGSASADRTACIWNAKSGHCLMQYQGHDGSVNSIRFQPVRVSAGDSLLVLTASGDQTAHVWKITSAQLAESSRESDEEKTTDTDNPSTIHQTSKPTKMLVNYPLMVFRSHTSAVSCAEWVSGAHQVITASWDRSAIVFDIETGDNLNSFAGHDDELTYVAVSRPQKLFVTCSKDTTFRLWDLREPNLQSVSVFQGHSDAVNCAVFTPSGESIVSGGDDKFLRVWDLRNMRAPKASVRMEGGVNRLSVSDGMVVCCPLDNRNIALYAINTGKLTRLPRAKRQGHQRMVTSASWLDDQPSGSPAGGGLDVNLLTCGFDRQVLGWKTAPM